MQKFKTVKAVKQLAYKAMIIIKCKCIQFFNDVVTKFKNICFKDVLVKFYVTYVRRRTIIYSGRCICIYATVIMK